MENNESIDLGQLISDEPQVTQQSTQSQVSDPVMSDIEVLFGKETGVDSSDGADTRNQRATSSQKTTFSDEDPFASNKRNMPRDPEALLRQLQSERDQARAEVQKTQAEVQKYKTYEDFLASIQEDKELRHAFIAELEPELVKPKDPLTFIQEGLKKEFPGFTPNADETNMYGSPTWLYNERAKDLFTEWKSKATVPPTLKELKAKRTAARQAAQAAALQEKQQVVSDLKWDENTWESFVGWVGKVKTTHMAKIWDKIQKQAMSKSPAPFAVGQSGGSAFSPSTYQSHLDTMFGKGPL